ncbi:MAG: YcaO-like family protein [Roseofilum sp. SBFL]|uniref:YcaO-like family protein n=1 Tax=unclassified Roseofilum TaxID=2620099 RepID=UPI001AFE488C|nr:MULTISPECIES: YcaO-like family protein [unclassified Roseofilum]MBP0011997.1 YcaO-like family protein [Roseofilum sp. SID3]MBP0022998.1 YcaO-like family protein [Roseofilum sp. SID2]MBP0037495.1 YcaO-like family protein [Roseofilum sp. SID1]MBP0044716.1 YcaO-like family protein [Roseofilum sp. SBFL]
MLSKSHQRFSSVRCVSADVTLSQAQAWAEMAGIDHLIDLTPLDRLGLPVFASIRPRAAGSAVTYGKGLIPVDAEVGAYMEAIELYFAEPATESVVTEWGTARDVAGTNIRADAILDFAPVFQKPIDLDAPLLLAVTNDVENGKQCLVPAELVYHPAPDIGQSLFGSSTNGLASGNSVLEATIHALAEVIERDIWSFEFIQDSSFLVDPRTFPALVGDILERADREGLQLRVRYVPNDYGLPFFSAFLFDPENPIAQFFNGGWGCHTHRDIALVRAVCEVAQSRLAFIHGGRKYVLPHNIGTGDREADFVRQMTAKVSSQEKMVSYSEIPDLGATETLEQEWQLLLESLRRVTDMPVYRVVYTPPDERLQVVRIIVPSLEYFKEENMRIGRRFKAALDSDDS